MFSYLSYFNEVSVPREWRKGNEEYTIPNMRWVPRTGIYRIEDVVCLQYEIGSQEMKKKDWGRYCSRHEVGSQGGKEKEQKSVLFKTRNELSRRGRKNVWKMIAFKNIKWVLKRPRRRKKKDWVWF